jgi:hypothetical protein
MPLVEEGAGSGSMTDRGAGEKTLSLALLFFSALLFAGLAILTPLANAQECSYNRPIPGIDLQRPVSGDAVPADSNAKGENAACGQDLLATKGDVPGENSTDKSKVQKLPRSKPTDFNRDIYFKNKLEFSLEVGWLPINIPFPFDVFEGDSYDLYPLRYTLVPIVASLRWHLNDVGGPLILRGNWDITFSASATAIPRGAETHYFSYDMGVRRNFVPRNCRIAPYWDLRTGAGLIDAKGPLGVYYAQGQNLTFTLNMGSGVRYNFNPRYAISAGLNWMHISNNNLSAPQYSNYGINVYGPVFGIDVQLRRRRRHSEQ